MPDSYTPSYSHKGNYGVRCLKVGFVPEVEALYIAIKCFRLTFNGRQVIRSDVLAYHSKF